MFVSVILLVVTLTVVNVPPTYKLPDILKFPPVIVVPEIKDELIVPETSELELIFVAIILDEIILSKIELPELKVVILAFAIWAVSAVNPVIFAVPAPTIVTVAPDTVATAALSDA